MKRAHLGGFCQMESERRFDTTMIRLCGEFDIGCKEAFLAELGGALDSGTSTLILDLRQLDFMDSTGLQVLMSLDHLARSDGLDFTVFCGNGRVRRVLRETGLDGLLPVVDPSGVVPATDAPV